MLGWMPSAASSCMAASPRAGSPGALLASSISAISGVNASAVAFSSANLGSAAAGLLPACSVMNRPSVRPSVCASSRAARLLPEPVTPEYTFMSNSATPASRFTAWSWLSGMP